MQKLVIIPGWGGSKETWKDFMAIARQKFDVVCVELPCFGKEPCPTEVWGVEEYAKFVREKILAFGYKPDAILGHSFGGQVAAYLVSKNNELCDMLVLSGAAVIRHRISFKQLIFWPFAKAAKTFFKTPCLRRFLPSARRLLYKLLGSSDYNETSGVQRAIFQRVTRQDVSDCLQNIAIPTLVVWGDCDKQTPLRHGKKIAKRLHCSELRVIHGIGHGLHLQEPNKLLKIIEDFLSSVYRKVA